MPFLKKSLHFKDLGQSRTLKKGPSFDNFCQA